MVSKNSGGAACQDTSAEGLIMAGLYRISELPDGEVVSDLQAIVPVEYQPERRS
jgi:hypothetical protein